MPKRTWDLDLVLIVVVTSGALLANAGALLFFAPRQTHIAIPRVGCAEKKPPDTWA